MCERKCICHHHRYKTQTLHEVVAPYIFDAFVHIEHTLLYCYALVWFVLDEMSGTESANVKLPFQFCAIEQNLFQLPHFLSRTFAHVHAILTASN